MKLTLRILTCKSLIPRIKLLKPSEQLFKEKVAAAAGVSPFLLLISLCRETISQHARRGLNHSVCLFDPSAGLLFAYHIEISSMAESQGTGLRRSASGWMM